MSDPLDLGTVDYTLGDNGFFLGDYTYKQDLACGYVEIETLVGTIPDPSFFEFLNDENRFELTKTEEIAFVGIYPMQIESKINVPIGLSNSPTLDPKETTINLTLNVINPCLQTVLNPISVTDMATTVLGPAELQDLTTQIPEDSVSLVLGVEKDGLTYCGERKFRITSTGYENYLSYNDLLNTLTLLATDDADIGANIPVTIEAYLVDYDILSLRSSVTFLVTVDSCSLTDFTAQTTADQAYYLYIPVEFDTVTV